MAGGGPGADLQTVADRLRRRDAVVLVDGRSGAGKSTFADRLVASWPGRTQPVLVRMDDIYPGWGGLDAASAHVQRELLIPRSTGSAGRWRRHDWVSGSPAEWNSVPADRPLVLEGCGSLSRGAAAIADLRIWLDADEATRKRRALARDAGAFDDHWDMWTQQMESFIAREQPLSLADVLLSAAGGDPQAWLDGLTRSP